MSAGDESVGTQETWDDFQKTLAAKSVRVMQDAVAKFNEGEMGKDEVILVCDTLFDTISGLAPWNVTDIIYKIREGLKT